MATTTTRTNPVTTVPDVAGPPWRALPVLLVGAFLFALDTFIVNVALPTMGRSLHAGPAALELVVAGYIAAYACCLVIGGRLGDALGRRRMFMIGMAGFTATSAACAVAPTAGVLVGGRVAQGITAAMMVPQILGTLQAEFAGQDRQRALGLFGATIGAATTVGQLAGGGLVSADVFGLGWRAVFLVNVPVGLAGLVAAWRLVPASGGRARAGVDFPGTALLAATLLLLLVPVAVGRDLSWPAWVFACLAVAPLGAVAFALVEVRTERRGGLPLVPPSLLRTPGLLPGLLVVALFFPAVSGFILTSTLTLQSGRGLSPIGAGVAMAPYTLGFLAMSLWAQRLVRRYGPRAMVGGAALLVASQLVWAVQASVDHAGLNALTLAPAMIGVGMGQGLVMIPLFGVVLAVVPSARAGMASAVMSTTQQSVMALGAAGFGTLFFSVGDWWHAAAVVLVAETAMVALAGFAAMRLKAGRD
jgi:MFS family permease